MKIIKSISEMKNFSHTLRKAGKKIGFVPTMGALHEGHLSLLRTIQKQCDISVLSIFVNPTQFGPHEDFNKYPRPFDEDCQKAKDNWCDIIFAPASEEMYPQDYCTYVEVQKVSENLCGKYRVGHFRGVATVVLKLINIVMPHFVIFGQKDAQQCIVIKRMIEDLNVNVNMLIGETVREPDGLAMSSRNSYLTQEERNEAPNIYKGLQKAELLYQNGERDSNKIISAVNEIYKKSETFNVEYIDVVDTKLVQPISIIKDKALLAVAVRTKQTNTRLIDNVILGGSL
jgi:pantoate--beta-alanine ligase